MMIAEKLRKSILQAAIAGKLSEQRKEDGDARDLLAAIKKGKAQLVRAGKLKKEKALPPVDASEAPFEIPENWCWARIGDVVINRDADRIPVSKVERSKRAKIYDYYGASGIIDKIDNYLFDEELLLVGEDGANLLARSTPIAFIASGKYWVNNHAHVLQMPSGIHIQYLCCFFNAINLSPYVTGTAQPKMNQQRMNSIAVPIPPFAEQKRIVEKINCLLPEVHALEADEQQLDALESAFPARMKSSLLLAAMRGELTEREAGDGDAHDLLRSIEREKKRLVKEKKLKKEKPLPPVEEDDVPFEIPETWCWVRIGMIGEVIGGGTPKTDNPVNWSPATIPWLTPADMASIKGREVSCGARNISEDGLAHSSARLMPAGTVLFSSRAPIGYLGIAKNALATNQGFKSIVPFHAGMSDYLYYCLMERTKYIQSIASGTTFQEVSGTTVKNVPIPLPPLAEQQRIVARLEELLGAVENG